MEGGRAGMQPEIYGPGGDWLHPSLALMCAWHLPPTRLISMLHIHPHTQYGHLHSKQKLLETASRPFWAKHHPSRHLNCRQDSLSLFWHPHHLKKTPRKCFSRSAQGFVLTVCVVSSDGCFIPLVTEGSDRLLMDGCCGMARKDGAAGFPCEAAGACL